MSSVAVSAGDAPIPVVSRGMRPDIAVVSGLWLLLSIGGGYRLFGYGRDYGEYVDFYSRLGAFSSLGSERFEIGFSSIAWFFKHVLGAEYELFATAIIGLSLAIKFTLLFKRTRWPLLAVLAYTTTFYILHEYTQIRVGIAVSFGFLSIFAYLAQRYVSSVVLIMLGASFQSSVLIFGLGIVILNITQNAVRFVGFALIVAFFVRLSAEFDWITILSALNPLVESYVENATTFDTPNPFSLANMLMISILAICAPYTPARNSQQHVLAFIMCGLSVVMFTLLVDLPMFAFRLSELFSVFVVFLAFDFRLASGRLIAAALALLNGLWSLQQAAVGGLIG